MAVACCGGVAAADAPAKDCAAITDPAARLACYDAQSQPGQGTPVPAEPANQPPAGTDVEGFGLPPAQTEQPARNISARIVGPVSTWKRGTLFKLDNGQVWKAVDQERGHYTTIPENPEVTISRNVFGAYWMEIVAVRARIKVKRIS